MRWALVLPGLAGCYFYAQDVTTTRVVASDVRRVPMDGSPPATTTIQATAQDGTLRIYAAAQRSCRIDFIDHVETTHRKKLSFDISDSLEGTGGLGTVFAIILAPITLPISAAIASAEVAGHHDTVTTEDKPSRQQGRELCPIAIARTLRIRLPSGATFDAVTAANGTLVLPLPPTEPDLGAVTIHTAGGPEVPAYYFRSHEICETDRQARFVDAAAYSGAERAKRLERLPRCKTMTTNTDPKKEYAFELAIAAGIAAARGECRAAFEREPDLAELDRPLHDAVFQHPEGVRCAGAEIERKLHQTGCMEARGDAMRAAQRITDPDQRGEALRRIPQCKASP